MTELLGNGSGKAPPKTAEELGEYKEFRLTSFAIDHSTSVILLFIIIAIAGMVTYGRIPKESFPELKIPMIAVQDNWNFIIKSIFEYLFVT